MTFNEFQKVRRTLQEERFHSSTKNPVVYGYEKLKFEEERKKRILNAAMQIQEESILGSKGNKGEKCF